MNIVHMIGELIRIVDQLLRYCLRKLLTPKCNIEGSAESGDVDFPLTTGLVMMGLAPLLFWISARARARARACVYHGLNQPLAAMTWIGKLWRRMACRWLQEYLVSFPDRQRGCCCGWRHRRTRQRQRSYHARSLLPLRAIAKHTSGNVALCPVYTRRNSNTLPFNSGLGRRLKLYCRYLLASALKTRKLYLVPASAPRLV